MAQSSLQQMLGSTEALCILLVLGVILCIVCMFPHSFSMLFESPLKFCGGVSVSLPMSNVQSMF